MLIAILFSFIFGCGIVYIILSPSKKIKDNELQELETLDLTVSDDVEKALEESKVNIRVIERYFYLKHKYKIN
jgi:hypothetical protein